jgi:hypothetical protein
MHRKDSGASGTRDHGDVEAFEAMSDLRGDRFFRLVESGTDSTEHCPQTLIDTTPSKMRDTRPSTAIQSSTTVTNFTADQSTVTQPSTMTHRMTQPSNMQRYSENPGKHYPCSNIRRYYDEIPYYDKFPYDDTPYSTLPYDDLPYDNTPTTRHTTTIYPTTIYTTTRHTTTQYPTTVYTTTRHTTNTIPFDGIHYDIILHDSTRAHPVLYSRPPHDRSSLAIPCTLNQFQELSSQSVMKFFPHFSHPPYNWIQDCSQQLVSASLHFSNFVSCWSLQANGGPCG